MNEYIEVGGRLKLIHTHEWTDWTYGYHFGHTSAIQSRTCIKCNESQLLVPKCDVGVDSIGEKSGNNLAQIFIWFTLFVMLACTIIYFR